MIKLFFCGDILYRGELNISIIDEQLIEIIKEHDIKSCNFEAPVVMQEQSLKKIHKIGPSHCQTKVCVDNVKKAGFNLINIANNHIMDYRKEGLKNTIDLFSSCTVIGAGLSYNEAYKVYRYEKDGISVSFISVAENGFGACLDENEYGYAWMNNEKVKDIIKQEKEKSDYVIMNCHAGAELFSYPLPEIKKTYKNFIDLGVDVIIGHHPHVVQGYEKYKNGMIFYSLGNFIFDGDKPEKCRISYAVSLTLKNKKEYEFEIIPCYFNNEKVSKYNEDYKQQIEEYSSILNTEEYNKKIDEFCEKTYNNTYIKYYQSVSGIYTDKFINRLKSSIKLLIGKNRFSNIFLYHNIGIETHLWICNRALKNKRSKEWK